MLAQDKGDVSTVKARKKGATKKKMMEKILIPTSIKLFITTWLFVYLGPSFLSVTITYPSG